MIVDNDAGSWLQGRYKILEEFDGVRGRIVMKDPSEVVYCPENKLASIFTKVSKGRQQERPYHQHP